jgi:succinate dehydrogenase flavin-adding protein (antitoxin of CptAB toxin-antitoxin module)
MSRERFVEVVTANDRELWLWLMGERQWTQFLTALAGRVVRRLPSPARATA